MQISRILKLALDAADVDRFLKTELTWAAMFDDIWIYEEAELRTPEQRDLDPLLRYRDVLRLGLAMWAAHRLRSQEPAESRDASRTVLLALAGRFSTLDQLLDVYSAAQERDQQSGATDWTSWFLQELPEDQAHVIPTSSELLFATLLLATRFVEDGAAPIRPRDWLRHSGDEIEMSLDALKADSERWAWLVEGASDDVATAWRERVQSVRALFTEAREQAKALEAAILRQSPLDTQRVALFAELLIAAASGPRLIRDTFVHQGAWRRAKGAPADRAPLVARSWLPKSLFVVGSEVHGMEFVARDLGRDANREGQLLAEHLASLDLPSLPTDASQIRDVVSSATAEMQKDGLRPSLIVLPLAWRLKEALGLPIGRGTTPVHPFVPNAHRRRFAGVLGDVPALDVPRLPDDRFFLVDLRAAVTFVEWPSERDAGIEILIRDFDADSATEFLASHPSAISAGDDPDQVALRLQERVLLSLTLCWFFESGESRAVRSFEIPVELRRNPSG